MKNVHRQTLAQITNIAHIHDSCIKNEIYVSTKTGYCECLRPIADDEKSSQSSVPASERN